MNHSGKLINSASNASKVQPSAVNRLPIRPAPRLRSSPENRLNATRQKAYALVNANIALEGPERAWEFALMSNNITNRIVTSNCTSAAFAVNSVGPGVITGGPARGAAGLDEVTCVPRRGREIWIRLTVRPMGLFGK